MKNVASSPVITCPTCGAEIELTEALLNPFQQQWKKQWEAQSKVQIDAELAKVQDNANKTIKELQDENQKQTKK